MTGVGLLLVVGAVAGGVAAVAWLVRAATANTDAADRALFWYDGADLSGE
jgi:hypothetical protein